MLNLLIMGDSIAKGYGSTDSKVNSFGAILGEKLSADVTNVGIVGLDTEGLLVKLDTEEFEEAVEKADVICLSIGSNDLLKPFLAIFADTVGVDGEEKELFTKIQDKLYSMAKKNPVNAANMLSTAMRKLTKNKQLEKSCDNFSGQFDKIIDKLHEMNPDVIIYADNIYNPYFGVAYEYGGISIFNISQLCEPYIQQLNKSFTSSEKYTVVDMYSIFRQSGYTHVRSGSIENMGEINLDPHPNDAGYRMMADYIYTKMDSSVPSVVRAEFIPYRDREGGKVSIDFSESIRLVKGGQLIITSEDKKDNFIYKITENKWIEIKENDSAVLTLDLDLFSPEKNNKSEIIVPGNNYTLMAADNSIKDKGNNQPDKKELLEFSFPREEGEIVATNTSVVKNPQKGTAYVVIAAGILIAILFIVILLKKLKGIDRNKKE